MMHCIKTLPTGVLTLVSMETRVNGMIHCIKTLQSGVYPGFYGNKSMGYDILVMHHLNFYSCKSHLYKYYSINGILST